MYNLKYKYTDKFGREFSTALNNILNRSIVNYSLKNNNNYNDKNNDIKSIYKYVGYIEDYFYCLIKLNYINKYNFRDMANQLENINTVNVIPKNKRRNNVYALTDFNNISINPDIEKSDKYSKSDREKLYMFHELGHRCHNIWLHDMDNYGFNLARGSSSKRHYEEMSVNEMKNVLNGLNFVDELTVQSTAEEMVCFMNGKKRDSHQLYYSRNLFDGREYLSNLDSYRELQVPGYRFATLVLGEDVVDGLSVDEAIDVLAKMSFQSNFIKDLDIRFRNDSYKEAKYMDLLSNMGGIKDACYSIFGMGNNSSIYNSTMYLNNVNMLCDDLSSRGKTYYKK